VSTRGREKNGNDTIDPYPLIPGEARKILIVKKNIFEELRSRYDSFCRSFAKGTAPKIKPAQKASPKPKRLQDEQRRCSVYEPSNTAHINDYNWRRWVRVKEWFNEFSSEAEIFERTVLIK
jgi:hypothetical protein